MQYGFCATILFHNFCENSLNLIEVKYVIGTYNRKVFTFAQLMTRCLYTVNNNSVINFLKLHGKYI